MTNEAQARNKAVVEAHLRTMHEARFEYLAPDARWTIKGGSAISGEFARNEMIDSFGGFVTNATIGRFEMTPTMLIAEDDRVVAQCRSHVELKSGGEYANEYVIIFRLRDGLIVEAEEYMDTGYVDRLFGPAA